ncbi:uncharacterized protein EDB91DRAFT_1237314 [Suillus paluster]|uniref:uncharacterized protein n=1 Tax=Suillus paluster TaxID=48578 RepID=UPI001B862F1D|nr:uncharacterized protein EDB91DRAFT_1237314 [Suillus paluster]KAG1740489.1 hypothetical protein EDB91DRAFT_1237314 [Suillus paluster]
MTSPIAPLRSLPASIHFIPSFNLIPNISLQNYPLIMYHECFPQSNSAATIKAHLRFVGVVEPRLYSTTYFHSITNKLCFGGEDNPGRVEAEGKRGDVVTVPAGVGRGLLQDLDGRFEMDMCYGREGEKTKIDSIKDLGWFDKNPIYGYALRVVHGGV